MPPRPHQGTAADNGSVGIPTRHTAGADSTSPEHGTLARRKYVLLAPTGTAVDPDDAGELGSGDGHKAIGGLAGQDGRETEEGDETRQRTLPVRGIRGASEEVWRTPEWLCALNACGRQGG